MKRIHLHVSVDNLIDSIRFYSTLFGVVPSVEKPDYAKWQLTDPMVNFAISQRGAKAGLDHLGIQVDHDDELAEIKARLEHADMDVLNQTGVTCCYANSDKHWVQDPSGIAWEAYRTLKRAPTFNLGPAETASKSTCCAPIQTIQFNSANSKGSR